MSSVNASDRDIDFVERVLTVVEEAMMEVRGSSDIDLPAEEDCWLIPVDERLVSTVCRAA